MKKANELWELSNRNHILAISMINSIIDDNTNEFWNNVIVELNNLNEKYPSTGYFKYKDSDEKYIIDSKDLCCNLSSKPIIEIVLPKNINRTLYELNAWSDYKHCITLNMSNTLIKSLDISEGIEIAYIFHNPKLTEIKIPKTLHRIYLNEHTKILNFHELDLNKIEIIYN